MQITMPQLGETIIEGTILKWLKAEGDSVALDEPLFEISTDKVDTEVPAAAAGVLTRILVPEGQTVAVGTLLAELEPADAAGVAPTPAGAGAGAAPAGAAPAIAPGAATPGVDGSGVSAPPPPAVGGDTPHSPPPVPQPPEAVAQATQVPAVARVPAASAAAAPEATGPRSAILSPVVRRLAQEHHVDLSQVRGTGTGGRITRADVETSIASGTVAPAQWSEAPAAPEAPAAAPEVPTAAAATAAVPQVASTAANDEVAPLSHLRRAIGDHMVMSLQTSARAWTMVEVDIENVVRIRTSVKDAFAAREGFGLTYMPFLTRAVSEALLAFPLVNAELRGDQLVMHHSVNMGVAVSIEGGLIVPVVKGADGMSLVGLARSIHDLAERARTQQLLPDEVHEATFTITNPGPYGSMLSLPIINQPNSAILSFDAIQKRPVVVDDAIAIRHMVYLSMSWDHRVIDGALATQFLAKIKDYLETWDFAEDLAP